MAEFGMEAFMNPGEKMSAILKQRYSDFIVHELAKDGTVIKLTETKGLTEDSNPPAIIEEFSDLTELISKDNIDLINQVINNEIKYTFLEAENLDKNSRTELHKAIRGKFGKVLDSQTVENEGKSCIKVTKVGKWGDNPRKRKLWPSERGDYLHFVLYKENKDSQQAMSIIMSLIGKRSTHGINFAGTKDKRAITSQKASLYRTESSALARINSKLRGMKVGNFSYEKEQLRLGENDGNMFSIVLRDIQNISEEDLLSRLSVWKSSGFINYFGSQRFGTTSVPTWHIGRAIIKRNYLEAVNLILQPREGGDVDLIECYKVWTETQDAEKALAVALGKAKQHSNECMLLKAIGKYGIKNMSTALNSLPRANRSMYVHSYQSIVWNKVVSKRVNTKGCTILKGDIVLDSTGEGSVIEENEVDKYNIYDVMLPLPTGFMLLPINEVAGWYNDFLMEDEITLDMLNSAANDYALHNSLRPVFKQVTDCNYEVFHYVDEKIAVFETDLDKLIGNFKYEPVVKSENTKMGVKLEFSLSSGTYATVALAELTKSDLSKQAQIAVQNFSLSSGTYATVALAELTKSDLSKQAQIAVQNV